MIGYIQKTEGLRKHQTKICAVQSGWQDWQKCKKDIVKAQEGFQHSEFPLEVLKWLKCVTLKLQWLHKTEISKNAGENVAGTGVGMTSTSR